MSSGSPRAVLPRDRLASRDRLPPLRRVLPRVRVPIRHRAFRALILAQCALFVGLGIFTAFDQPFYARVDERAQVSYIETVATQHRLPVLGVTCVQGNLVPLQPGYPGPSPGRPCLSNANAAAYEAFQPPLFYILAAPLFKLPLSLAGKIRVERLFCLFLVALTIAVIWRFLRREVPNRAAAVFSLVLCAFLVPGFVLRSATVDNGALEVLMTAVFLTTLWTAVRSRRPRQYVYAGVALGLSLLTKISLIYLVVPYLAALAPTVWPRVRRRELAAGVVGLLLTGVILSPWLAFNESHYGTLTSAARAYRLQESANNPTHRHYTVSMLPSRELMLVDVLPDEWQLPYTEMNAHGSPVYATKSKELLSIVVICSVIALLTLGVRRWGLPRRYLWFVAPALLVAAELGWIFIVDQENSLVSRFLYPALPPVAIAVGLALLGSPNGRRRLVALAAAVSVVLVCVFGVEARHGLGAKCCVVHGDREAVITARHHHPA